MSITWTGRLSTIGATANEVLAITAAYNASPTSVQQALDTLVDSIGNASLLQMLNTWRSSGGPFQDGYPGGGLPFGTGVAVLTGNPADDTQAVSAGTGQKIATGGSPTKSGVIASNVLAADLHGSPEGLVVKPEDHNAKGDGVEFTDGAITSGLKVLTTSASSAIALNPPVIGQRIYIEGAGAAGLGLRSSITGVNYAAGTITINDAAGTTIASAGVGCFGTDDTAAFNSISYNAGAWAIADAQGNATVLLDSKKYMLDSAPGGLSNSIWQLGITSGSIKITGVSGHTKLLTTRNVDTYTSGQTPKVMGVPVVVGITPFIQNYGRFEMTGVTIQLPGNPTIGGVNTYYAGRLYLDDFEVTNYLSGVSIATHVWQAGIILPGSQNFGEVHLGYVFSDGNYCNFAIQDTAHLTPIRPIAQNGVVAYGIDDNAGGGHATHALYLMAEHHTYVLAGWTPDVGVKSKPSATPKVPIKIGLLDIEDASAPFASTAHVLDANNMLYGEVTFLRWAAAIQPSITITGGANLYCKSIRPGDNGTGSPFCQVFTSSGTWTKPGGVNTVQVSCVGGGGGGQSGATAATSVAAAGGGGGGAGGWSEDTFAADALSATVTVTVGAGGVGGTAISANSTPGGWSGKAGAVSSFGAYAQANGGTESTGGSSGAESQQGAAGGAANTSGAGGGGGSNGKTGAGGAGGSLSSGNVIEAIGPGGTTTIFGSSGSSGQAGSSTPSANLPIGGSGGAGGAAVLSGTAGTGGAGGTYGGGGGGGGAARNGGTSGAGGAGGNGVVIVKCWP